MRSDIFFRGNSNYQQLSSNLKIFLIAVILLAIIRTLFISFGAHQAAQVLRTALIFRGAHQAKASFSQAHQLRSVRSKEKREWQ